jgi:hypothetical protein
LVVSMTFHGYEEVPASIGEALREAADLPEDEE